MRLGLFSEVQLGKISWNWDFSSLGVDPNKVLERGRAETKEATFNFNFKKQQWMLAGLTDLRRMNDKIWHKSIVFPRLFAFEKSKFPALPLVLAQHFDTCHAAASYGGSGLSWRRSCFWSRACCTCNWWYLKPNSWKQEVINVSWGSCVSWLWNPLTGTTIMKSSGESTCELAMHMLTETTSWTIHWCLKYHAHSVSW